MSAPIEFYFDLSSPYGFLAAQKIDALAAKHGRSVDWRPVLLGVMFKETGMAPLTEIPLKGEYSKRDFARSARFHGIAGFRQGPPRRCVGKTDRARRAADHLFDVPGRVHGACLPMVVTQGRAGRLRVDVVNAGAATDEC